MNAYDRIPDELRAAPLWTKYYLSPNPKRPDKKPRKHPEVAYRSPEERKANLKPLDYLIANRDPPRPGGGYQRWIDPDEPFTYIDIDHCRDVKTGEIEPWAQAMIEGLDSYTEISASGTGFHIVCRARLSDEFKLDPCRAEIYGQSQTRNKLLAMTGDVHALYTSIEDRQQEAEKLLKRAKAGELDPKVSRKADAPWQELFHTYDEIINAPPVSFAIDGFLQDDGVTMLGALAGHGKTLVMLAMVRALLEGGKLFDYFKVNRQAERTLYLIPESALTPFAARLKLFHLLDHVKNQRLFVRTLSKPGIVGLADPRILEAAAGADVFLDTAVRFMSGDENSAGEQKQFAEVLFSLIRSGARTVTGAHHSPKGFARETYMDLENVLRGSGDIGAMLVTAWGLRQINQDTNQIYVKNIKPRDFLPCEPFIIEGRPHLDQNGYFLMTEGPGSAGELEDHLETKKRSTEQKAEKKAEAKRLRGEGFSYDDIAARLDVAKGTVHKWLKDSKKNDDL